MCMTIFATENETWKGTLEDRHYTPMVSHELDVSQLVHLADMYIDNECKIKG